MFNYVAECKMLSGRVVQQYRVVDLLGLGIMCGVLEHVCNCTLSASHPYLVCFLFVPALYSTFILHLLVSSLFVVSNDSRVHSMV